MKITSRIQAWFACWNGCAYCGRGGRMTRDHVIPKSRGGKDSVWNVVPACRECNTRKASLEMHELPLWMRRQFWHHLHNALQKAVARDLWNWKPPAVEMPKPKRDPAEAALERLLAEGAVLFWPPKAQH